MTDRRSWVLIGDDGRSFASPTRGTLGGHRKTKVYGRLDCPTALRYLAKGRYAANRVFFADAPTAVTAGYRPCARCLPDEYRVWKSGRRDRSEGQVTD
jgi:methylphosphotriester-DNA--protein-cysteine methyltransferase